MYFVPPDPTASFRTKGFIEACPELAEEGLVIYPRINLKS
jgi:hypothetical protein